MGSTLSEDKLPAKGTYTLVISLKAKTRLKVRKLGSVMFQKGYYAYTGSAVGDGAVGLRKRVARHLRRRKIRHWHIDFLLADKDAVVVAIIAAESDMNNECRVNNAIKNTEGIRVPVLGFGASDCEQDCQSHLVYFESEGIKEKIVNAYARIFGHDKVTNLSLNPTS